MKQTIRVIVALALAIILGMTVIVAAVLIMPERFDEVYFGEMADKYERLRTVEGEKIVVIGGSSVAFGVNSEMMENYLGRPVVNFGLYGPLGTTIMLDLTRGHIREGDIVVIAAEPDHQTMSMTFNGEGFWQCCDSDFTMLFKLRGDKIGQMLGSFWTYAQKKLNFYRYGKAQPNDVYSHSSFNERGDMVFRRNDVDMDDWFDDEVLINLDPSIIDDEFIDYVNDYVAYCERQGATVYWSYPPMNILAVQQDYEERLTYATYLREHLDCEVISNLDDYILWPGYFYDTNYHVNTRGVSVHTANLTQDLVNMIGDGERVNMTLDAPLIRPDGTSLEPSGEASGEASSEPETDTTETDETEETSETVEATPAPVEKGSSADAEYFLTEESDTGLRITGVTDAGKALKELEVPWEIDGTTVTELGAGSFDGCSKLTTIYIQSNITRIVMGAFDGAPALSGIYIDAEGQNVLIPGKDLFENVPSRCKVYVSRQHYGSFIADYFWGNYNDRIEISDK